MSITEGGAARRSIHIFNYRNGNVDQFRVFGFDYNVNRRGGNTVYIRPHFEYPDEWAQNMNFVGLQIDFERRNKGGKIRESKTIILYSDGRLKTETDEEESAHLLRRLLRTVEKLDPSRVGVDTNVDPNESTRETIKKGRIDMYKNELRRGLRNYAGGKPEGLGINI